MMTVTINDNPDKNAHDDNNNYRKRQ